MPSHLFIVDNTHSPESGKPPQIDGNKPGEYHGYFQNEYGDQFVFVYDYNTQKGHLWAGDAGWGEAHDVVDGNAPNLILGANETLWLQVCWKTVTANLDE